MKNLLSRFAKDESGATAIEYGLIAGLVSIAMIAILPLVGGELSRIFGVIRAALSTAV